MAVRLLRILMIVWNVMIIIILTQIIIAFRMIQLALIIGMAFVSCGTKITIWYPEYFFSLKIKFATYMRTNNVSNVTHLG